MSELRLLTETNTDVLDFFKFAIRKFNEILTDENQGTYTDLVQIEYLRDCFYETEYLLELLFSNRKVLEDNALKKPKVLKSDIEFVVDFLTSVLKEKIDLKSSDRILKQLVEDNNYFYQSALDTIKNYPLFIIDSENNVEINQAMLLVVHENHPIHTIIQSSPLLSKLNSRRTRNFVIFDNSNHQVIFDMYESAIKMIPKVPFSDIEHDTNRTFAERVVSDLLFDYENRTKHFIKLLSKNKKIYQREIDILTGFYLPSKDEVLVLLSVLGRLQQQNDMGPITTFRNEKLLPSLVVNHKTTLKYMETTINTMIDFNRSLLSNQAILELPFGKFETIKRTANDTALIQPKFILDINQGLMLERKSNTSTNYIRGNVESSNYLEAFFRKISNLPIYEDVIPYFDYEAIKDVVKYSKRHKGPINQKDFMIAAKMRGIMMKYNKDDITSSIHQVFGESRFNTYSKIVSEHLITFNDDLIKEFYRLFFLFIHHIESEKNRFISEKNFAEPSDYNDGYLSIISDMHFNDFNKYEKSNYSSQFNIIAGDFADNLFHRSNVELTGKLTFSGVGVLGNHDVFLENTPSRDLRREIKSNFLQSIQNINRYFPNIKILNDEIFYKDGFAIIGMTLVYDENDGIKTFFANVDWGSQFNHDNYLERAKSLLDKVDKSVPIIFISHSPFKEYSVCSNKTIGVPSNWIFKDYPNVKIYIHGHGHSRPMKKIIKNILCITNPVIFPESIFEMSFTKDEITNILELKGNFSRKLI